MSQHTRIAGITVGQSPRTDMTCDLIPKLALNLELVEYGALDGLTLADIERDLAPEPGQEVLSLAKENGLINSGDLVCVTAGDPNTAPSQGDYITSTNMLLVAQVPSDK